MPIIDQPQLLKDLKSSEGCKLIAYRDTKGLWTIAFGHLLDQAHDWTGHEITQETADGLLAADVEERRQQCFTLPEWKACDSPARANALLESVFNLGIGTWKNKFPNTRRAWQARNWPAAGEHLLASPEWIRDVGIARVSRIARYISSGHF